MLKTSVFELGNRSIMLQKLVM